jgi:hypothetical protein
VFFSGLRRELALDRIENMEQRLSDNNWEELQKTAFPRRYTRC